MDKLPKKHQTSLKDVYDLLTKTFLVSSSDFVTMVQMFIEARE
jgi:hypothetical protein